MRLDIPTRPTKLTKPAKILLAGLAVLLPMAAATAVVHAHDTHAHNAAYIDEGRVVNGSHFAAGREVVMAGEIDGDYFCAGQNVTISGRVKGDVLCAAQHLRLSGSVEGDVRVAAQTASSSADIAGSLSAAVQSLRLESGGSVGRDASLTATDVGLAGTVGRDLRVAAENLRLEGQVGRHVQAQVDGLSLGNRAAVAGNLTYHSDRELLSAQAEQVAGQVRREAVGAAVQDWRPGPWLWALWVMMMLTLVVTALVLVALAPAAFRTVSEAAWSQPWLAILTGLLLSIALPAASVTLLLTVVGIPLGLLLGLLWLAVLFLSGPIAAYVLGRLLLPNADKPWLHMLAGSLVLVVLYSLPVLNVLAALAVVWLGSGALARAVWFRRAGLLQRLTGRPRPAPVHKIGTTRSRNT